MSRGILEAHARTVPHNFPEAAGALASGAAEWAIAPCSADAAEAAAEASQSHLEAAEAVAPPSPLNPDAATGLVMAAVPPLTACTAEEAPHSYTAEWALADASPLTPCVGEEAPAVASLSGVAAAGASAVAQLLLRGVVETVPATAPPLPSIAVEEAAASTVAPQLLAGVAEGVAVAFPSPPDAAEEAVVPAPPPELALEVGRIRCLLASRRPS